MTASITNLDEARAQRAPDDERIEVTPVTSTDIGLGFASVNGRLSVVIVSPVPAIALSESEARQHARNIIDTCNELRAQRNHPGAQE
jgi:hypothetical protein